MIEKRCVFVMVDGFRMSLEEFQAKQEASREPEGIDYRALGFIQDILWNTPIPAEQINHTAREIYERLDDNGCIAHPRRILERVKFGGGE